MWKRISGACLRETNGQYVAQISIGNHFAAFKFVSWHRFLQTIRIMSEAESSLDLFVRYVKQPGELFARVLKAVRIVDACEPLILHVLFTPGQPVEEFDIKNPSFLDYDQLLESVFRMFSNENPDAYNISFRGDVGGAFVAVTNTDTLQAFLQTCTQGSTLLEVEIIRKTAAVAVVPPHRSGGSKKKNKNAKKKSVPKKAASQAKYKVTLERDGETELVFAAMVSMLVTLATFKAIGILHVPKDFLFLGAGYSSLASKTPVTAFRRLSERRFIEASSKSASITDAGLSLRESTVKPMETREDVFRSIKACIGQIPKTDKIKPQKCFDMIDALQDGGWHSFEEVAETMGHGSLASKGFQNSRLFLKSISLVEERKDGRVKQIRLTKVMFPSGRPVDELLK